MRPVFDLEKLNRLLRDFYEITNIRITVFDERFSELTAYPQPLSPLCRIVRSTSAGRAACRECDQSACRRAADISGAYIYRCHAGLTEAIMPLQVDGTNAGYMMFGQVMCYETFAEGCEAIKSACAGLQIGADEIDIACRQHLLLPESYIRSASHILRAVASYSVNEKMASLKADRIAEQLDTWLSDHYTENLSAHDLCDRFGIGKTQLYAIGKQLYGCGLMRHVRDLRMDRARRLLVQRPDMSVSDIAFDCGYSDYNYFISVFSHLTGKSPNRYRREAEDWPRLSVPVRPGICGSAQNSRSDARRR